MPEALQNLIRVLSRLPGVGRRTAERMAWRLLLRQQGLLQELRDALDRASREITLCKRCGNFAEHGEELCSICRNPARHTGTLCLVEGAPDIQLLEQSGAFQGSYFCLGGKISPQQQETVAQKRLAQLASRIREDGITEVILAFNTDVESDATASMLAEYLHSIGVKSSRLAFGLPAGSGLAYSDPETVSRALSGRQEI